jgi:hypothetical protein
VLALVSYRCCGGCLVPPLLQISLADFCLLESTVQGAVRDVHRALADTKALQVRGGDEASGPWLCLAQPPSWRQASSRVCNVTKLHAVFAWTPMWRQQHTPSCLKGMITLQHD